MGPADICADAYLLQYLLASDCVLLQSQLVPAVTVIFRDCC